MTDKPKGQVLVVDDEKLIRWSLNECLTKKGYQVREAADGKSAFEWLEKDNFDLLLLDYKLPDTNGLEILKKARKSQPDAAIIMITAHSNVENAVKAIQLGANDYLAKPFRNEDILMRVEKALETGRLKRELDRLKQDQWAQHGFESMIASAPAMKQILRVVERVIHSPNATILLQGESGTGKDVLAKAIHYGGPRADGPYINITCTAIPETLLESELFGHERGAFTDARKQKKGLVEQAESGTLFLDEIGDMSGYLQGKILRFLEEKTFRRVGGDRDFQVDVRVIAATNKNLKELVAKGDFREDLYFRLKVIPIQLPPLRERREDIPLLTQLFVDSYSKEFKRKVSGLTPALMNRLLEYDWPGNIRELKNTIERAMILGTQDVLDEDDLPVELFDEAPAKTKAGSFFQLTKSGINFEELEKDLLRQALELTRGNQTRAGKLLGINRDQVRYRIEKFGLQSPSSGDDIED